MSWLRPIGRSAWTSGHPCACGQTDLVVWLPPWTSDDASGMTGLGTFLRNLLPTWPWTGDHASGATGLVASLLRVVVGLRPDTGDRDADVLDIVQADGGGAILRASEEFSGSESPVLPLSLPVLMRRTDSLDGHLSQAAYVSEPEITSSLPRKIVQGDSAPEGGAGGMVADARKHSGPEPQSTKRKARSLLRGLRKAVRTGAIVGSGQSAESGGTPDVSPVVPRRRSLERCRHPAEPEAAYVSEPDTPSTHKRRFHRAYAWRKAVRGGAISGASSGQSAENGGTNDVSPVERRTLGVVDRYPQTARVSDPDNTSSLWPEALRAFSVPGEGAYGTRSIGTSLRREREAVGSGARAAFGQAPENGADISPNARVLGTSPSEDQLSRSPSPSLYTFWRRQNSEHDRRHSDVASSSAINPHSRSLDKWHMVRQSTFKAEEESLTYQAQLHSQKGGVSYMRKPLPFLDSEKLEATYRASLRTVMSLLGPSQEAANMHPRSLRKYLQQVFRIPPATEWVWRQQDNVVACKESVLRIEVIEAFNLKSGNPNNLSDPYVTMVLDKPQEAGRPMKELIRSASERLSPAPSPAGSPQSDKAGTSSPSSRPTTPVSNASNNMVTRVITNTLNPVWNETFEVEIDSADKDVLQIYVVDRYCEGESFHGTRTVAGLLKGVRNAILKEDIMLGRVTIPLSTLPFEGSNMLHPLRHRTSELITQGELRLRLTFVHKEKVPLLPGLSKIDYLVLLRKSLIFHEKELATEKARLSANGKGSADKPDGATSSQRSSSKPKIWNDLLPEHAEYIFDQFVAQQDITAPERAMAEWLVIEEAMQSKEGTSFGTVSEALDQLKRTILRTGMLTMAEELHLVNSLSQCLQFEAEQLSKCRVIFPPLPVLPESIIQFTSILECVYALPVWQHHQRARGPMSKVVEALLEDDLLVYFEEYKPAAQDGGDTKIINISSCEILQPVHKLDSIVEHATKIQTAHYSEHFARFGVNYESSAFTKLDQQFSAQCKQLVEESKSRLESQHRKSLAERELLVRSIFQLFVATRQLAQFFDKYQYVQRSKNELHVADFHVWFSDFLPYFLEFWGRGSSAQVERIIELDPMTETLSPDVKFSFSAVDVLTVFNRIHSEWTALSDWPDPAVNFDIIKKVINIICQAALDYALACQHFISTVQKRGSLNTMQKQVAIVVNNIGHVASESVRILPTWFGYKDNIHDLDLEFSPESDITPYQSMLRQLVETTNSNLWSLISPILKIFVDPLTLKLHRILLEYPEKQPSLFTVLSKIFGIFERQLLIMKDRVHIMCYRKMVLLLWTDLLGIIYSILTTKKARRSNFFIDYSEALDSERGLVAFFIRDTQAQLTPQHLAVPLLKKIRHFLAQSQVDVDCLLLNYYHSLAKSFPKNITRRWGSLTVQAAFLSNKSTRQQTTLQTNLLNCQDVFTTSQAGEPPKLYIVCELNPSPLFQSVGRIKTEIFTGGTAFIDQEVRMTVEISLVNQKGTVLRLSIMEKRSFLFSDCLLGQALLPLSSLTSVHSNTFNLVKSRQLVLNVPADDFPEPDELVAIQVKAGNNGRAQRLLDDEKHWKSLYQATNTKRKELEKAHA